MFVSLMRDHGYFAEVLHEHVAVQWGPLPMGGVAAWVSEEAADETPDANVRVHWMPVEMSVVLGHAILAVIAITLVLHLVQGLQDAVWYPMEMLVSAGSTLLTAGIGLLQ